MLWILLSCTLGYQQEDSLTTISVEQTEATHHYNSNRPLKSSLKILAMDSNLEEVGHGSGNYFKIGKHRFILTAEHLIDSSHTLYADDGESLIALEVVHADPQTDVAILAPLAEIKNTKAINYSVNTKKDITGLSVVYAGYPANLNASIFNGMISRCASYSYIMQSFALPGSSGSVVFDNSGKVTGVVSAIKVGYSGYSPFPDIYPALVYVARVNKYTRSDIKERLVKWKNSKLEP